MANMMTPLGCNKCGYRKRTTGELITLRARIAELEAENARLKGDAEKWRKYQSALKAALSSEREG